MLSARKLRITLGEPNGTERDLGLYAPTVGVGQIDGAMVDYIIGNDTVTYECGPWGVGLIYLAYDLDDNGSISGPLPSDGTGGTFDLTSFGGTYTVAPGLTVGADLGYHQRDRVAVNKDTEGFVVVSEVKAAF